MTAHKHQPQAVITNFVLRKNRLIRCGTLAIHQTNNFCLLVLEDLPAPHDIQREIARRAHDPGRRILRHSIKRPGLQRARQRFLHDIFSETEMFDSENSR